MDAFSSFFNSQSRGNQSYDTLKNFRHISPVVQTHLKQLLYFDLEENGGLSLALQMSTLSDYYLGGEGDLFKAPEPIIEEPFVGHDPMTSTISLSLCGEVGFTNSCK